MLCFENLQHLLIQLNSQNTPNVKISAQNLKLDVIWNGDSPGSSINMVLTQKETAALDCPVDIS